MSLRWTEEELEEYQRRIKGAVKHANDSLISAANAMRDFIEDETKPRRGRAAPTAQVATEDEEQMALFTWANHMAVTGRLPELSRMFHVPNGGSRGPAEAGRFKAMGVKPGVPDVFLDGPRGGFHGLRIEMKRRHGGKVSEDQTDWIGFYNSNGFRAVICYGWDEAREEIENYLHGGDGE